MIVFDLKCDARGHVFEAWFGNSSAYDDQKARGLLICPLCGDTAVTKALMAPHIAAKGSGQTVIPLAKPVEPDAGEVKAMLSALAEAQSKVLKTSTWVGRDFDKQARAMDAGETDKTSIHGEVSKAEAKALIEDGIGVMPLLLPVVPPEQCN